jgi:NAD(P)-dependent dehydrogenase (short-subunit alcohol dehydrogenase family)
MSAPSELALDGWAVVLGASSGFGAAAALRLARAGCDVVGVHLDRRAASHRATRVAERIRALRQQAIFFNANAADEDTCARVLDALAAQVDPERPGTPVRVLLHSLAFGTLLPFVPARDDEPITQQQLEMTSRVMAHSLVLWTQGLVQRRLMHAGGRVFAMTSTGAVSAWAGYGAVSAAKAALEAHVRQLAVELAPRGITVNAICAGVADTPALRKIPTAEAMMAVAVRKNPHGRLGRPEEVADAIVALAQPCTYWMTGNVIHVDGGEAAAG